jgi:hypothetical protein
MLSLMTENSAYLRQAMSEIVSLRREQLETTKQLNRMVGKNGGRE